MQVDAEYEAHHELVERVVRRVSRELDLSCDPEDLKAWGHQGVLEAKARFDADRGVRFSTFAYYRVRGAVLDGVRKQGFMKRRAYAKLKALEATDALGEPLGEVIAQSKLAAIGAATGPTLSVAERAERISDTLGKISAAFMLAAVGQGEDERPDTPEQLFEAAQTRDVVKHGLAALPERERSLVEAVYFEGVTIEEAGLRLGLSKSWASRMHAKALERLRKALSATLLAVALMLVLSGWTPRALAQPSVQSERVAHLIARGESLRERGDAISALAYFRDAINAAPRRAEGYLALGQLYMQLDEPLRALEVFEAGARLADASEGLWLGLAATLNQLGQHERALTTLRQLRSRQPSPTALGELASLAEARGAFIEALAARRALVDALADRAQDSDEARASLAAQRDLVRALELLLGAAERVRSKGQCAAPGPTEGSVVARALARCR